MLTSTLWAVRRRWPVAVGGLVVTAGLMVLAAFLFPAAYVASAQVVLLPPASTPADESVTAQANPYLNLNGLQALADLVARATNDEGTARELKARGATDYTVAYDALSAGPVLRLEVQEPAPARAVRALEALMVQVSRTTARLQAESSVSEASQVRLAVVSRPSRPERSGKTQIRALAVAGLVGVVLTLVAVSVTDSWSARKLLRAGEAGTGTAPDPEPRDVPGPASPEDPATTQPLALGAPDRGVGVRDLPLLAVAQVLGRSHGGKGPVGHGSVNGATVTGDPAPGVGAGPPPTRT